MTAGRAGRGFALLELLVVVTVLAATAALAIAALDSGGDQTRRDLTQSRLRAIRLGMIGPAWEGGPARMAGYAADIGSLPPASPTVPATPAVPTALAALVEPPTDAAKLFALKAPLFDSTPDANGFSHEVGIAGVVQLIGQELSKGWRGPYLELVPGASNYRDGWGNQSASNDDENYGWLFVPFLATTSGSVTTVNTNLGVTSLGKNGAEDTATPADPFDADMALSIAAGDWLVDTANWQVTVSAAVSGWYSVSLLVYVDGLWRRLSTAPVGGAAPAAGSCGDAYDSGVIGGDRAMVYLDGSATCGAQVLKFPLNAGYVGGTVPSLVPYGRHLLVVVKHDAGSTTQTVLPLSARTVDLVRGTQPPAIALEARS